MVLPSSRAQWLQRARPARTSRPYRQARLRPSPLPAPGAQSGAQRRGLSGLERFLRWQFPRRPARKADRAESPPREASFGAEAPPGAPARRAVAGA
eukprot:11278726-Alexandrium_andersonii.AAC.1